MTDESGQWGPQGGYPPQSPGGYPPQSPGGYPPQQPGGYPPQQPRAIHRSRAIHLSSRDPVAIRRRVVMQPSSLLVDIHPSSQVVMDRKGRRLALPVQRVHLRRKAR